MAFSDAIKVVSQYLQSQGNTAVTLPKPKQKKPKQPTRSQKKLQRHKTLLYDFDNKGA